MKTRTLVAAVWILGALAANEAGAHFLFIRVSPVVESGRTADVFFSARADAGDPEHVKKIAHTSLWAQTSPGEFQPLTVRSGFDRLRAHVPGAGGVGVVGRCEYGVLNRPDSTFLLRYYPKAVAGDPDELARLKHFPEIPFEIDVAFGEGGVVVSALQDGKPTPGIELTTVDPDLVSQTLKADGEGKARWSPPVPGLYCIYARRSRPETGELDGKAYTEVREFATIVFTWPPHREGADAEAVSAFQEAVAARATWAEFPGFTARISGQVDERPFVGKIAVAVDGAVDLTLDDPTIKGWIAEQVASIVMHRRPEAPQAEAPVLRFVEEDVEHPLGQLLEFEGGRFASSYRVKDGRITVVNRHMGRQNLTITVLDEVTNAEGRTLPRNYTVQVWDDASGRLERTETIQERWTRVGAIDLPTSHVVTSASERGLSTRSFELSEHKLGGAAPR